MKCLYLPNLSCTTLTVFAYLTSLHSMVSQLGKLLSAGIVTSACRGRRWTVMDKFVDCRSNSNLTIVAEFN